MEISEELFQLSVIPMVVRYSNGGLNTRISSVWYSNIRPFGDWTNFDHLKTRLVNLGILESQGVWYPAGQRMPAV